MKSIWLTSLVRAEEEVKKVMAQLKAYGLKPSGHFWEDDLEKLAWIKPRSALADKDVVLWAIMGTEEDFQSPALRYGLSLLAITVQAERGADFPIVVLQLEGQTVLPEALPTPLKGVDVLPVSGAATGPKLVAKAHRTPQGQKDLAYRLDLYGNEHIGQWFEVGPGAGAWSGAMFAVSDAEIVFHGIGPKGRLPEKSVLNYPMKGLKLTLGDKEYTAWAVQNPLDGETSYFVKVQGFPESILFGAYTQEDNSEVFAVSLK
ncbi:MAG: hypothetical protein JRI36_02370 [Deltaproteobacteria bacterium]|nr:hypothetical protein [Deltaproteobacteria bacterium]